MKIDRSKLRKGSSQLPADCRAVIERLRGCDEEQLLSELRRFDTWNLGKCELYHWIDVLDKLDSVLEEAATRPDPAVWPLTADSPQYAPKLELLLQSLHFTALLIEHSFSRHLYNSVEHLIQLLEASNMMIVLQVLDLIYMFSKRSNFITRLSAERRAALVMRLTHLAESWGGKENGYALADCCRDVPVSSLTPSATTLHFEYYGEEMEREDGRCGGSSLQTIHMTNVHQLEDQSAGQLMQKLLATHQVPPDKQMMLFTYLRLAKLFGDFSSRLYCVWARLQALSILVYSNASQDNMNSLLYPGLLEELVEVLEMPEDDERLIEIKAASLRTLTAVIHLDRNPSLPKLNTIIEITGANSFHGFLPQMVRSCITYLTAGVSHPLSSSVLTTALFSFLYHLASYETGGDALVHCGMMQSLLSVVSWSGTETDHVTFVTRAVRVIDLITNLDMNSFQNLSGLQKFISRLQSEVDICRVERPYQIPVKVTVRDDATEPGEVTELSSPPVDSMDVDMSASPNAPPSEAMCLPQRSALLKSMLNFLKKAIQDSTFNDSIRHLMDGSLPDTLKHVISNAEYYGPSLFLLAIDVVTAYSFQEPSLLGALQDNGLTSVVLHALLVKHVPATREVLSSLPNVFSALCLNARGLNQFVSASPFERLFGVLLSADYLPAMRRRRGSDPLSDTATKLGNAMDELMRHQPTLRTAAVRSIVDVLRRLCEMGRDPQLLCCRPAEKSSECVAAGGSEPSRAVAGSAGGAGSAVGAGVRALSQEGGSSDEEEEDEELPTSSDASAPVDGGQGVALSSGGVGEDGVAGVSEHGIDSGSGILSAHHVEKQHVPLIDYVHNVMKFVDAILSNNSTDDHCREFVTCGGLTPLLSLLSLPNLPLDFPQTPACQAVASVCKAVVSLAHEGQVLSEALDRLSEVVAVLEPLQESLPAPGGSVLLHELAGVPQPLSAPYQPQAAPLLHAMSAAHAYIATLIHISRTGQADIRQISVSHWGSASGVAVLRALSRLYTSIVWEGTVLLSLCTPNAIPADSLFAKQDLDKLIESKPADYVADLSEDLRAPADMLYQMKAMKPLLASASKLGRILTDLFALLVKLCVGSPMRQRRSHHLNSMSQIILPSSRNVARSICFLLTDAVSYEPPDDVPSTKLRLTVYTCTIGFVASLLFDEKKFPYHLMLQMFRQAGGIEAFFNMFRTVFAGEGSGLSLAEGVRKADLTADGVCEFLDAWLGLLERLVSPRQLLDSPHNTARLSADSSQLQPFNAQQFMAYIHKMAFQTMMVLWHNQPVGGYTSRHAECILAVLRHVLRGEVLLKESASSAHQTAGAASVLFAPAVTRHPVSVGVDTVLTSTSSSGAPAVSTSSSTLSTSVMRALTTTASSTAPTPEPVPAADSGQSEPAPASDPAPDQSRAGSSSEPGTDQSAEPAAAAALNDSHLQRLLDMGFPRQQCVVALHLCANNVQLATDYLLVSSSLPQEGSLFADGVGVLAGSGTSDPPPVATVPATSTPAPEMMDTAEQTAESAAAVTEDSADSCEPLSSEQLDTFSESMLTGCLQLLDAIGETVYRTCDLIYACVQRNGDVWRDGMLKQLVSELCALLEELISASNVSTEPADRLMLLSKLPCVSRTAVRIHLLSLLFEEMAWPCCAVVADSPLRTLCITLLRRCQMLLTQTRPNTLPAQSHKPLAPLPRWLAPLVLLVDMFEKFAVASQKRAAVAQVAGNQWRWYESYNHRWLEYPSSTNTLIDQAYWAGRASVDIQSSGWKHIVTFGSMAQVHDDTNSVRPVMLSLRNEATPSSADSEVPAESTDDESPATATSDPVSTTTSAPGAEGQSSTESGSTVSPADAMLQRCGYRPVAALDQHQCEHVLDTCVDLLTCRIDADMLQAVLRLCLRLTRKHSLAVRFAEAGGIDKILALHQDAAFSGLITLVTFLVRHAIEDEPTLKYTMDKVIRTVTFSRNPSLREFHSVMRMMGPAICRDEQVFAKSAQEILRVDMIATSRRTNSDDSHLIVKPLSGVGAGSGELTSVTGACSVSVVNSLLHSMLESPIQPPLHQQQQKQQSDTAVGQASSAEQLTEQQLESAEDAESPPCPLLGKSSLCRMLAELVRSFPFVAKLVTEYSSSAADPAGTADCSAPPTDKQCSALAYVLDHLSVEDFTPGAASTSSECVNACLLLVSAIASCTHSPEAQSTLVSEVRTALLRALLLPESSLKHYRVQTLACFVHAMIECCPSAQTQTQQSGSVSNIGVNNIVKIMARKGLISDLARVSHSLDLCSPHLAVTMNAVLKSLELLTRLSNSQWPPCSGQSRRTKTSSTGHEPTAEPATDATSNSEATNAQGESILEDPENTEHDVSGADPASEAHAMDAADDNDEAALEEIMGQLLGRSSGGADDSVLADSLVHEQSVPAAALATSQRAATSATADDPGDHEQHEAASEPETRDSDGDEEADGAEEEADGAEEEEPDDDDDDEDDEEEEDEEGSNYDEEPDRVDFEDLMYFIQGTGMRDVMDEYLMIRGFPDSPTAASLRPRFGDRRGSPRFRPVPAAAVAAQAGATDSSTGNNETAGGAGVSGAGQVPPMHPLLAVRSNVETGGSQRTRGTAVAPATTAGSGHRGYHYIVNTRHRRPAILQRLLGPHTHDVLQLAVRQGGTAAMAQREPPFLLGPEPTEFRVFTHDDEWHDDTLSGLISGAGAVAAASANAALGSLALIPSAFARWTDESRVLDTLSMLDCVTASKPALWASLQHHRSREQAELTERRQQQQQQQAPGDSNEVAGEAEGSGEAAAESSVAGEGEEEGTDRSMPVDLLSGTSPAAESVEVATTAASARESRSSLLEALSRIRDEGRQLAGDSQERIMDTLLSQFGATGIRGAVWRPSASGQEVSIAEVNAAAVGDAEEAPGADGASAEPSEPAAEPSGAEAADSEPEGAGPNAEDFSSILGDMEIPEGVDPSFLAALPEDMRQEVVAEQLRLQRIRQRYQQSQAAQQNSVQPSVEVSPEFLDALPPAIQEEVLAQQRQEQQRLAAVNSAPDEPVDPGDFLQTLPAPLRQSILADLEDSQLGVLPPGLAAEAQALRRENEVTHRRHAHEPIDFSIQSRRNHRYAFHLSSNIPQRSQWRTWTSDVGSFGGAQSSATHVMRMRGRQLLDQEAIACLLVLLFVDQPKLNTSRVHRVLRNLSYHCHTREWIMRSLLSMLERCDPTPQTCQQPPLPPSTPPSSRSARRRVAATACGEQTFSWLNVSMDAALGCRANVFQLGRTSGSARRGNQLHVHQQAAAVLCRHALDTLVALAKCFPGQLLPAGLAPRDRRSTGSSAPGGASAGASGGRSADLWELLVRLDAQSQSAALPGSGCRVRALSRSHSQSSQTSGEQECLEPSGGGGGIGGLAASPFGQLMHMLQHPVIARSVPLTDQLLHLLSLLSVALRLALEADSTAPSGQAPLGPPHEVRPLVSRVVHVLASRSCSEEGMDDATKLLLNISAGRSPLRHIVMDLLLDGARSLGESVCQRIDALNSTLSVASSWYQELASNEQTAASPSLAGTSTSSSSTATQAQQAASQRVEHGIVQNRYTNEQIVINASRRVKCSGLELQLSSMATLTSKHSPQRLFLRVLKVIIQIRNANAGRAKSSATETAGDGAAGETAESQQTEAGQHEAASSSSQTHQEAASSAQTHQETASSAQTHEEAASSAHTQQEATESGRDTATTSSLTAVPAMDVDSPVAAEESSSNTSLSQLLSLSPLWEALSCCLQQLDHSADQHAVLILQPAVEAFFLVHASGADQPVRRQPQSRSEQLAHISATADFAPLSPPPAPNTDGEQSSDTGTAEAASSGEQQPPRSSQPDTPHPRDSHSDDSKFVQFADRHRTVLNQILRQSGVHLADGPFSVLVNHTRVLDFDIKRRFFRTELERLDERLRREDLAVHVRRPHVFEDSYRELQRRSPEEWKNRFYIVFEGEEGQDAGGLLREWYIIIAREIFNPMYALFCTSPGDRVTYMIHHMSHCNSNHLSYFKFVGRVIAKAVYDNKLLDCYFSRSFYKHILGIPVKYTDMEAEDYDFYKGLVYLMEHDISELGYDLTFSTDIQEFGVNEVRDLKLNGRNVKVTEANKMEYVRLVCQMKMTGAIRKQLEAFLEGFYDIIPKHLISVFNEQELELLISGLPAIDLDDLKANTEYYKYQHHSIQIQWFWMALRSFSNEDRAKFIQFVTGTSRVPLQGFAELQGMNGAQKFQIHRDGRSTDRLPSAHTCFNQLDLPVYETYDKLRSYLLKAVQECSEGFGFI